MFLTDAACQILSDRNWQAVKKQIHNSSPFNYAILDDFLTEDVLLEVQKAVTNHWGWKYKNWVAKMLHNDKPDVPLIKTIGEEIKHKLPDLLEGLDLVNYWCLMAHNNIGINPHSDDSAITINLWLTPDVYNQNPNTGGLILYDVKRGQDLKVHEFTSEAGGCTDYLRNNTNGEKIVIPYRCNRAVIFDGKTFHSSDVLHFKVGGGAECKRINLTYAYDNRDTYLNRLSIYAN